MLGKLSTRFQRVIYSCEIPHLGLVQAQVPARRILQVSELTSQTKGPGPELLWLQQLEPVALQGQGQRLWHLQLQDWGLQWVLVPMEPGPLQLLAWVQVQGQEWGPPLMGPALLQSPTWVQGQGQEWVPA